jgi:hypothetical protein
MVTLFADLSLSLSVRRQEGHAQCTLLQKLHEILLKVEEGADSKLIYAKLSANITFVTFSETLRVFQLVIYNISGNLLGIVPTQAGSKPDQWTAIITNNSASDVLFLTESRIFCIFPSIFISSVSIQHSILKPKNVC